MCVYVCVFVIWLKYHNMCLLCVCVCSESRCMYIDWSITTWSWLFSRGNELQKDYDNWYIMIHIKISKWVLIYKYYSELLIYGINVSLFAYEITTYPIIMITSGNELNTCNGISKTGIVITNINMIVINFKLSIDIGMSFPAYSFRRCMTDKHNFWISIKYWNKILTWRPYGSHMGPIWYTWVPYGPHI